jgi:hypothetical protein
MAESAAARQVCVLLREGQVLTDDTRRLPSYEAEESWDDLHRRSRACGDEKAVLVAPQLRVRADPTVLLSVFGARSWATVEGTWTAIAEVAEDDDAVVAALLEVAAVVAGHAEAPPGGPDGSARPGTTRSTPGSTSTWPPAAEPEPVTRCR